MKQTNRIVSMSKYRLNRSPVTYTIEFRHDGDGMSFIVYDIEDTEKDRIAVATDLEVAAASLKD